MPAPARTSLAEIVTASRAVLADEGLPGLTMQRVADATGVRAPSLYKRVAGRSALVRLVTEDVVGQAQRVLAAAANTGDPALDLRAMALALREFALKDPHGFDLLFSPQPQDSSPSPALFAAAAGPVLRAAGELAGPEQALAAARTVTAWASGFIRMELAGAFQLGGSTDEAFDYGITLIVEAIAGRPLRTS